MDYLTYKRKTFTSRLRLFIVASIKLSISRWLYNIIVANTYLRTPFDLNHLQISCDSVSGTHFTFDYNIILWCASRIPWEPVLPAVHTVVVPRSVLSLPLCLRPVPPGSVPALEPCVACPCYTMEPPIPCIPDPQPWLSTSLTSLNRTLEPSANFLFII